jgi:DNA polymerase-3 subunit delta'
MTLFSVVSIFIFELQNLSGHIVNNALLKFLEEPFEEIYAIFTSTNISRVLPTITSRCQVYSIASSKTEKLSLLSKFDLSSTEKDIVISIYKDLDNLKFDIENSDLHELIIFSEEIIKAEKNVITYKKTFESFKKKSYYEIELIIKILFYLTKVEGLIDILDAIKLNSVKPLLFDKIIQLIKH